MAAEGKVMDATGTHRDVHPKDHPLWAYFVVWWRACNGTHPFEVETRPYHPTWDAFLAGAGAFKSWEGGK